MPSPHGNVLTIVIPTITKILPRAPWDIDFSRGLYE
jgi:hypothetical protein